jgi:hypothetical protein
MTMSAHEISFGESRVFFVNTEQQWIGGGEYRTKRGVKAIKVSNRRALLDKTR